MVAIVDFKKQKIVKDSLTPQDKAHIRVIKEQRKHIDYLTNNLLPIILHKIKKLFRKEDK